MPSIVVLANCEAGTRAQKAEREGQIRAAFAAAGAAVDIRCVDGPALGPAAAAAMREGPAVVVAAGGDGTVSAVAGALAGTGTAMGVLPMGTLNHFARDAGIPSSLGEAAAVAVSGEPRPVDVAEVNGHVFVNNSSIGIYPRTVRERERQRAAGGTGSKRLGTVKAAWTVLRRLPAHRVLLTIDGRQVLRTTSFVFVGNNLYETGFGKLGTRTSLAGGRLGVYHSRRPARRAILGLAARALVGRLDGSSDLQAQEAHRLTIQSWRREMRVALDGEVVRMRLPLEYRIRPGDLMLMQPKQAGGAA